MKKSEVIELYKSLVELFKKYILADVNPEEKVSPKFVYALRRNIDLLESEVKTIDSLKLSSKDFMDYEKERIELVKKYATKDKNGEPIIENGEYKGIDTSNKKFLEKFNGLNKKYENFFKELGDILKEDVDVKLYQMSIDNVPSFLTKQEMNIIYQILEK